MKSHSDGVVYLDSLGNSWLSWEDALARSPEPNRIDVFRVQEKLRESVLHWLENKGKMPESQESALLWDIGSQQLLVSDLLKKSPRSIWRIPVGLVRWLSHDRKKLWESATIEEWKKTGKYNQIKLSDSGELWITIIKPGVMESLQAEVDAQFVEPIREYVKENPLDWDRTGEGFKHGYTGLGGVYEFVRVIPLLRQGEGGHNIDLRWIGRHTNPVIEWSDYHVNDEVTVIVRPTNYNEPE